MSVFILKLIAMITMAIDHIGSPILGNYLPFRRIGRFAFPIYTFLLAEGFRHIKGDENRVMKHLSGYILLALVSEAAYDLLEASALTAEAMFESQSVMVTLLLSLLGLMAFEKFRDKPLIIGCTALLCALASQWIKGNYKFVDPLLLFAFYYYLNHVEGKSYIRRLAELLGLFLVYLPIYHWARYNFCSPAVWVEKLFPTNIYWYITHIAAAAVLAMYNGNLGYTSKRFNIIYKYFYPAHLLVLGVI